MTAPSFWLVAGPNGSGKTTLVRSGVLRAHIDGWPSRSLNPDEIAASLRETDRAATDLAIVRDSQDRSDRAVDAAITAGASFMVETVLSSDKFKAKVTRAISAGFRFGLVFVTVDAVDMNIARVSDRVAKGGHDVPADRVAARRLRSHAAFGWFAHAAHMGFLFDNTVRPVLVAEKPDGAAAWTVHDASRHPDLTGQL